MQTEKVFKFISFLLTVAFLIYILWRLWQCLVAISATTWQSVIAVIICNTTNYTQLPSKYYILATSYFGMAWIEKNHICCCAHSSCSLSHTRHFCKNLCIYRGIFASSCLRYFISTKFFAYIYHFSKLFFILFYFI